MLPLAILILMLALVPVVWFVVQYNSLVGLRNFIAESRTPDIGFSIVPDFIGFCSSD